jgi:hypothetical protein
MQTSTGLLQMKLRVPPELRQWIKEVAEQNKRSENSEILVRLEECMKSEKGCRNADR